MMQKTAVSKDGGTLRGENRAKRQMHKGIQMWQSPIWEE